MSCSQKHAPEPIAIVGSGCRFPGGASNPSSLWKLLERPRDVCNNIGPDRFDTTGYYHPNASHHGTTNVQQAYLLQDDVRKFDAGFFNISPNEADSIDPQQRLLLETVYEAMEAGGHTIEALRGSDTAVYVGTMGVDYNDTLLRDINSIPTYFATGTNRAIISNRVSYFFDWHGPSMTIDTACSSSLIAVHQGVQALRTGDARIAVACGTQIILGPEVFIFESKMKMLSPTGRSRMWDSDADGYARGEGVAAVVLKRLSDAIADGDHIHALIRETGANQDGHSSGLTVPSSDAQAALIRKTYRNAGLDLEHNAWDRPQFFEAHGTGTKAGDPKEAAAIYNTLGKHCNDNVPLYVGSVKTIIGHTEGAAGLAGLLKGVGMINNGIIPPNMLFNNLNPDILPFYKGLRVPTVQTPWPQLPEGVPRRVSVNSFGFGGANAHAILESYSPETTEIAAPNRAPFVPFVFSAGSDASLAAQLQAYSKYLKEHQEINPTDLAWTLQSRRSHLPIKASFSAKTIEQLVSKIDDKLAVLQKSPGSTIGARSLKAGDPKILGVFTGQGAQWAAMGAELIRSSDYVRQRIHALETALTSLPDSPEWSLETEMLAGADTSRIAEAKLSQPLCTAIQIVLVDLLRSAGIEFSAVVGHSSGEIGAAYAAGFLSDADAIRVAYYRGVHAKLAGASEGQKGAMLAVGTSLEDAQELIKLRAFRGKLAIAAHNSSASVTLSGDADTVILAKKVFDEEKKFARMLKVDTAYHSHHMLPCGDAYINSLRACGVKVIKDRGQQCGWFSSVTAGAEPMDPIESIQDVYWRDNMANSVLFADAVKNAVVANPQITMALEVGPHPALKGPAAQNIAEVKPENLPYSGVLSRGKDDVESFSDALGFIWATLGPNAIDLESYEKLVSPSSSAKPKLVVGLPSYQWNHGRIHWHESRTSRKIRGRNTPFHEILGTPLPDSTDRDMRWTNLLRVNEIPWLEGHQLQSQKVFPAAGYCAMALEGSRALTSGKDVKLFEVHDLFIPRAIIFEDDDTAGVETLITMTAITKESNNTTTAQFSCYSAPGMRTEADMELMASASVEIHFGTPDVATIVSTPLDDGDLAPVDTDRFYGGLGKLGYGYSGPFRTMDNLKRKLNQSSTLVGTYPYNNTEQAYLVHPTMLDVAFQASMLAYSAPGDDRLWSLHVPTSIRSIKVNPELCAGLATSGVEVPVYAVLDDGEAFHANLDVLAEDGKQVMVQVEDLAIKPFAPATEADDHRLFSYTKWDVAAPDGASIVKGMRPSNEEIELAAVCERVSGYYLRQWKKNVTAEEWANGQPHHACLRDFVDYTLDLVSRDEHPAIKKEWSDDSDEEIMALIEQYSHFVDVKLLHAVGQNIPAAVRGETTILEHMLPDNMLDDFYKKGLGFAIYNTFLAGMMEQVAHRYPHAKILEIGAGTGGATKAVLGKMGQTMSSYTYTDISVGFFEKAGELFRDYRDKMTFKTLDVERNPSTQGYESNSYDIIIASNVLHATASLHKTLEHTRQLMKPGGYLLLLELTNNGPTRCGNIMSGLSGWWTGANDGRKYAPTITPVQWNTALRKAGFSGVDACTPEIDVLTWPFSIMAAQAVDDRIQFLRRPLMKSKTSIYLDNVVVLAGEGYETAEIAEEVSDLLIKYSGEMTVLNGLPTEEEALELAPGSTFINLIDLDSPIFKDMTAEKMDGLRRMYDLANHILWVTVGAQSENPYAMASIAFSRAISHEAGHISMNHLDFSEISSGTPKAIAEHLLRQSALDEWEVPRESKQSFMWSKEPEMFLDNGKLKVPRVVANVGQNQRLNSSRRTITKTVSVEESPISIHMSADSPPALVEEITTTRLQPDTNRVRVEASSLMALRVDKDTFLYLGVGKDNATKQAVVTLSSSNSIDCTPLASVPGNSTKSADNLLLAVASEVLTTSIIEKVSSGSSLLVHCSVKDLFLAAALSQRAAAKGVCVTFACDKEVNEDATASWVKLGARAPRHVIRKQLLPAKATHFLDLTTFSHGTNLSLSLLSLSISQVLPSQCRQIKPTDLSQYKSLFPQNIDAEGLKASLQAAVIHASQSTIAEDIQNVVIPLDQLRASSLVHHTASVVSWAAEGNIKVEVRPLDATNLFSADKSYLLVGLTGQIGRSLCEWMVSNGAGCVCLTSRNPKASDNWLKSFEGTGVTVKVYAMDVTSRSAVEAVVNDIKTTCPPIAGVANGAMVLHDSLFEKMSVEIMQKVLRPKIEGSNILDNLFKNVDLDFFVMFSSSACVIGNSGQANYAASNGYLNSLVRQRRKRGLAASAFDIGRVAGIGYVETAGQAVMDQLNRFGLKAISETEFRQMFAESIRAGYPKPEDKNEIPYAVITTGIRTIRDDEEIQGPWFDNPRFSHCIIESKGAKADDGQTNRKTALPVAEQLSAVTNGQDALNILQECFSNKLRIVLQISDQAIDYEAPLVELGVDSLVAVEVRSWFLKELKVDIPVLKVVGGASVADLCQWALGKLPQHFTEGPATLPTLAAGAPAATAAAPVVAALTPIVVETPSSTATFEYNSTPSGPLTPGETPSTAPTSAQLSRSASFQKLWDTEKLSKTAQLQAPVVEKLVAPVQQPTRRFVKSEQISFGQSRFWFLRLLLEDQTTFNVAFYYRVTGDIHVSTLERAVRLVSQRHEALRTCFVEDPSQADKADQKVLDRSTLRLETRTIQSEDDVAAAYHNMQTYNFDLEAGDLMRLLLLTLSPTQHFFLVSYHHILMDGVSFQNLLLDLEKAYKGQSLGPAPRQFPAYSAAQRQAFEAGEMDEELTYWRGVFPADEQPPVLPLLPMARTSSRVLMKEFDVHQVGLRLDPALAAKIKAASKAARSTPFHFYVAALKAMLFAFTDVQDLTIGIADANRQDADVAGSLGFFLNLLTLRFRRHSNQRFVDAVAEARNTTYAALGNSRLPFDVLLKELNVARSSSYSPFFQAFFDYRVGAQEKHPFGNVEFEAQALHPGRTAYDITLDVTENAIDSLVTLRVQKSLYDETAAKLLLDTYVHLLNTFANNPQLPLESAPLFSQKQLSEAVEIGRGHDLKSTWPETLPHRIDQVAEANQTKLALMDEFGGNLTYSAMISRIEAISEALQGAGIAAGSQVLVFQKAASNWICSMLAIMRIGAVYVPLDLRNPLPRLASVAVDCEPSAILVDETTIDDVPQLNVPTAIAINVATVGDAPSARIPIVAQKDSIAAILYTSGSTGKPKGIMVKHTNLCNEIEGYTTMWKLGAENILQQSAYTFNHSSDQIYTGLTNGGMVYTVPWSKRGDPLEITKILAEHSITYTKATPSEYSLWMQYGREDLQNASQWRYAFGGGEPLTHAITQEFADLGLPGLQVFNSYGPTEISISSTKMEIKYRDSLAMKQGRIPCGFSLPNYATYVVDADMNPLPAGMPGEVCLGGAGVAIGYLNNKELTDKSFITNPFATARYAENGWTRLYRTGDIGHLTTEGAMVFHNRIAGDTQVKIRGLRIELSDIESNIITASAGVLKEAIVTIREGDLLVSHVIFAPQHGLEENDKEKYLEHLLSHLPIPQYMVPAVAIPLDKLPLTLHSKVDRKALQVMPLPQRAKAQQDEEMSETMVQLQLVWKEILGETEGLFDITPSTSFFLVGGNSLLVIRLQSRIREVFNCAVPLIDLLGSNTLGQMARKIEEASSVGLIDWEEETTLPTIPSSLDSVSASASVQTPPKTLLITGATGFLGKYLLPQLAANPDIETIHCVAVREKEGHPSPRKLFNSPKVVTHPGNLSSPLLGLTEKEFRDLSSQADVILHMGAVRSFWDNYHTLRPSNVQPTKELVKLAAPRRIPIHYISTMGVFPAGVLTSSPSSASAYLPNADGVEGYVASRWASERILERSTADLGVPTSIYRFLPSSSTGSQKLMDEFVRFVDVSGLMPDFASWEGRIDLIHNADAIGWVSGGILAGPEQCLTTKFQDFEAPVALDVAELRAFVERERGNTKLERIGGLAWVGRIKELGFEWLFAGQQARVGRERETRR